MNKYNLNYFLNIWKYALVIPHLMAFKLCPLKTKILVVEDVRAMNLKRAINESLAYYLIYAKPYRNLFYSRVGRISKILKLFLPEYPFFFIGCGIENFGGGANVLGHPYGTFINAKSVGRNFTICQLTTIGNKMHGRNDLVPIIGNDVSLGANVNIIGNVKIGSNVVVGAGSVVVNDIPDNCVVAGNPAKVIRYL